MSAVLACTELSEKSFDYPTSCHDAQQRIVDVCFPIFFVAFFSSIQHSIWWHSDGKYCSTYTFAPRICCTTDLPPTCMHKLCGVNGRFDGLMLMGIDTEAARSDVFFFALYVSHCMLDQLLLSSIRKKQNTLFLYNCTCLRRSLISKRFA